MEKFVLSIMKKYSAILIVGKRATGKTTLVGHIINDVPKVTTICATTRTGNDNDYYRNHLSVTTCLDYDTEYDKFTDIIKKEKEKYDKHIDADSCIVIDGCINGYKEMDKFKELIMNCRHWRTTVIITTQYLSINPSLKSNFDYIFCFRENIDTNLKKVYEFVEYKGSFEEFKEMYNKYTQDHNCLVYETNTKKFYCFKVELQKI